MVVRHHQFENYPQGTTPHTTAPLDYLILGLSILLRLFAPTAIDLSGALVSPLLAVATGWFLWWWSRTLRFRYRWAVLLVYGISPILVHGTELGRPDHQSLTVCLVIIAICLQWQIDRVRPAAPIEVQVEKLDIRESRISSLWMVACLAWGVAIWVSAYEPLILFAVCFMVSLAQERGNVFGKKRRSGWICFGGMLILALAIERRVPSLSIWHGGIILTNWKNTIGELRHVSLIDPVWFRWVGYLIIVAPILIWMSRRKIPVFVNALLLLTFCLTIWQVRWAYFFAAIFALALLGFLETIQSRTAVWTALVLSILPTLRDWDAKLWPNDAELARRAEVRRENVELHNLSRNLMSVKLQPFLAPWWLSPSIAYWSGQPGVAGSSHESLGGIADSARFFAAQDYTVAKSILVARQTAKVIAYNSDRVLLSASAILGVQSGRKELGWLLDRTPTRAPRFLTLEAENGTAKLFQVNAEPDSGASSTRP